MLEYQSNRFGYTHGAPAPTASAEELARTILAAMRNQPELVETALEGVKASRKARVVVPSLAIDPARIEPTSATEGRFLLAFAEDEFLACRFETHAQTHSTTLRYTLEPDGVVVHSLRKDAFGRSDEF